MSVAWKCRDLGEAAIVSGILNEAAITHETVGQNLTNTEVLATDAFTLDIIVSPQDLEAAVTAIRAHYDSLSGE